MRPEDEIAKTLETKLEYLLIAPAAWGNDAEVESRFITLLELRHFLLEPCDDANHVMRIYNKYVAAPTTITASIIKANFPHYERTKILVEHLRKLRDRILAHKKED